MFDIVVVPDFRFQEGKKKRSAACFEARTLLFLASWMENAGKAKNFPLHLACIGEPPERVKVMAQQVGASITVHEPFGKGFGGYWNKLRGLEINPKTNHILLLDVDMLILSDPSSLAKYGDCIAAPYVKYSRFPNDCWAKIYQALDLEYQAVPSSKLRDGLQENKAPIRSGEDNLSYHHFHAGMIYTTWDIARQMRSIWEEHFLKITSLFSEDKEMRRLVEKNEPSLATTMEYLRKTQGVCLKPLDKTFHTSWEDLYYRNVKLQDVKFIHLFNIFCELRNVSDYMIKEIGNYCKVKIKKLLLFFYYRRDIRLKKTFFEHFTLTLLSFGNINKLKRIMFHLYIRYVRPLSQGPSEKAHSQAGFLTSTSSDIS